MVLLAAACFGGIPVLVTLAMRAGATLAATLFWRYAIGAALLAVMTGGLRAVAAPGRRALHLTAVLGVMQAAIAFISLSALRWIPAATVTFLFFTFPAWITLLEAARGRERLTARRAGALLLALAGVGMMVGLGGAARIDPRGVLLAIGAAMLYAVYVPLIGGYQRAVPGTVVATYASAGAAAAFLVAVLLGGAAGFVLPATGWAAAAILAVVSTAAGFRLFLAGLATLGSVRTAILGTLEPFCTAVLAALLLDQRITARAVLGGALIASAVVVLQWQPGPRERTTR
ncbi:MAG TPA: DMT family transporter [Gemmatimonadaceae bacterium]|nr:DMT family transporter [Gemmatimonadaceae bacterium]